MTKNINRIAKLEARLDKLMATYMKEVGIFAFVNDISREYRIQVEQEHKPITFVEAYIRIKKYDENCRNSKIKGGE